MVLLCGKHKLYIILFTTIHRVKPPDPIFLISTLLMGPSYSNKLTVGALFRVNLLFALLSLCHDQVLCAQPQALCRSHRLTSYAYNYKKVISSGPFVRGALLNRKICIPPND